MMTQVNQPITSSNQLLPHFSETVGAIFIWINCPQQCATHYTAAWESKEGTSIPSISILIKVITVKTLTETMQSVFFGYFCICGRGACMSARVTAWASIQYVCICFHLDEQCSKTAELTSTPPALSGTSGTAGCCQAAITLMEMG